MQVTTSYSQTDNNKALGKPAFNREFFFRWLLKPAVFILLLLPVVFLAWGVAQDTLGANPVETVIRDLGEWGLRFLLLTLLVSPLRRLFNMPRLLRFRRMLGLFAFFYVSLHVLAYVWLDQGLDWQEIWLDILDRPFITVGMLAFVLLIPLALTSTKGMIRRLGKNWKRLHRLVYPIAILAIVHFFWMVKLDITEPVIYAFLLFFLLAERLYRKYL